MHRRIGPDYYQSGIKLEYDLLWQALVDVVGEENTLLLPYELMNESLTDFLRRYFSFLERPEEGSQIIEEVETNSDPATRNVRSNGEDTWAPQDRNHAGCEDDPTSSQSTVYGAWDPVVDPATLARF